MARQTHWGLANTLSTTRYVGSDSTRPADALVPVTFRVGTAAQPLALLDAFERLTEMVWRQDVAPENILDQFRYSYNRIGLRQNRNEELYGYDRLDRLVSLTRPDFQQQWQLDLTDNWSQFRQDDDGDGKFELIQRREHNAANEISRIIREAGVERRTPTYDAAGNTIWMPQSRAPKVGIALCTTPGTG